MFIARIYLFFYLLCLAHYVSSKDQYRWLISSPHKCKSNLIDPTVTLEPCNQRYFPFLHSPKHQKDVLNLTSATLMN